MSDEPTVTMTLKKYKELEEESRQLSEQLFDVEKALKLLYNVSVQDLLIQMSQRETRTKLPWER